MKTQVLFTNGDMQILLIPESHSEKALIEGLYKDQPKLVAWTEKGQFTERVGGQYIHSSFEDHSMIISVKPK